MKLSLITTKVSLVASLLCFNLGSANSQSTPTFNAGDDPKPSGKEWVKVDALTDEFDGSSLNSSKWTADPSYDWNGQDRGWYGSERSLFEEENATVTSGQLRIEGEMFASPKYGPQDDTSQPAARKYGGAYVYGKTLAKPGYYMEARMKASNTAMSAAFWLMSEPKPCLENPNNGERSELDIQECVGIMTGELGDSWTKDDWAVSAKWDRIFHFNTHRHNTQMCYTGSQQTVGGKVNLNSGLNRDAFHIYGAYWHPDGQQVDYYLDGEFIKSVTPAVQFTAPLRLIMSSNFYDWIEEVSKDAMGFNNSKADRSTKFDWVRTWELKDAPTATTFFIINKHTGKKIRHKNSTDGEPLELVPSTWSGDPTKWTKIDTSNGYFYLKNVGSGMYFRPTDDTDGSVLIQRPTSYNGDYTQWKQVSTSNGYFYLQNKATGMYFRPDTDADYSPIIQRPTSYSGDWTQWQFVDVNSARFANSSGNNIVKDLNQLKVFPNPAQAQLNLQGIADGIYKTTIYNLQGKVIKQLNIDALNHSSSINIADLQRGLYFLNVQGEEVNATIRFVKE